MRENDLKNLEIHIISNTHWDIEYLWSLKETQMMLEEMLDSLIHIFETNPDYKHYHFDAQTFPIDEYVKAKPENLEKIKELVKSGKLLIGPWYTLPEEFLVSGEALVRNLLIGHKKAKAYGKVMKAGYNIFSFGQISQLPQIYKGFGIDTIVYKRGINQNVIDDYEFYWESPDGSSVFASRIGPGGRSNFTCPVYVLTMLDNPDNGEKWGWNNITGTMFNLCDQHSHDIVHHQLKPNNTFKKHNIERAVAELKEKLLDGSATMPYLLTFDGYDQASAYTELTDLIKELNNQSEGITFYHSSLPEYLDKVKDLDLNLKTLKGEMRYADYWNYYFPGVLSSRMPIKQMNSLAENDLEKWAEPSSVFSWLLGKPYPSYYLQNAWEDYLINQHHDGITGTHLDRVFLSMMERYRESIDLSENISRKNLEYIAGSIDGSGAEEGDVLLTVFNSLPYKRSESMKVDIDFFFDKDVKFVRIVDPLGREMPVQKVFVNDVRLIVERTYFWPMELNEMRRMQIHFMAEDIPAMGYKTFIVKPVKREIKNRGTQITSINQMENEYLIAKINYNGTIDLTDKQNNITFKDLLYFVDNADLGHPLFHNSPEFDQTYSSLGCACRIALVEDNALSTTFMVTVEMALPEKAVARKILYGEKDGSETEPFGRSSNLRKYPVTSHITLKRGARRLDVTTRLDNTIEDHRLRVCFPTRLDAKYSYAEGQYDVVERPIDYKPDLSHWELENMGNPCEAAFPQRNFVDVNDGAKGLTIINSGLPEYEVLKNQDNAIAVTLLRCNRISGNVKNSTAMEQPLAQCPGHQEFRYAIYPHIGAWSQDAFEQAYTFNVPMKVAQVRKPQGNLPKEKSFIQIEPSSLVVSAVKQSEKGGSIIIRLWNPTDQEITGKIAICNKITAASLVNLEEEELEKLEPTSDNAVMIKAGKKKIITLALAVDR